LRVSQRIRAADGRSVHDLDLHARDPPGDFPAVDGVARLCACTLSAPEHRTFRLGPAGLSTLGADGQRVCAPCKLFDSCQGSRMTCGCTYTLHLRVHVKVSVLSLDVPAATSPHARSCRFGRRSS